MKTVIGTVFKAIAWYVNNVTKPALQVVGKVIVWLYKNVVKPNFAAISTIFKAFGQASRAMGGVIKAVFSAIGNVIKSGVSIARKAIGLLRGAFQSAADKAKSVKDAVSGAFGRMANAVSSVKDRIVKIIDSIKRAWKSMVDLVSKPIKAGVNGIKGFFGRGKDGGRSRYASGGVLPGYSPGRDIHHYINPATGHVLSLSGGEAIMRPEWVKQQGGSSAIDRMNRAASGASGSGRNSTRRSRFASGGVVRFMNQLGTGNISIENPVIKTNNANIESDDATVNAKESLKQQIEEGISSRKTMADLRADIYAKQHKGEVGQAVAEQMKAQAAFQEISEKLNFALRSGESSSTIEELRLQLKLAGADVQAASENIREATKAEAERAREELKTKLQERAQYRSGIRDKNAELFDAKNFDNPSSLLNNSVKTAKNALLDAQDAVDIARKTGSSRKEIKLLEKDVKIAQANVQRAEKERIKGIEEENKKRKEAAAEAADEQTKFYVSWFDGLQDMGEALSSAFKSIADISRGVKEALNNAISSVQAFGEAWNNMISAHTEIRKAERNLARVRADSADKILEAQKEIKKQAKQNLRLVSTAPANLKISAEIDRTTTTLQRLGGTFIITADEMKRREATIAEARAQAALDSAQAEYELKKARIDGAKAIVEQRKATQMLNNSLQEYILKARLVNGLGDRDTSSLEKFFEGFSQKTKGEALLIAAAQELKVAQMSGNAVKAQEAMAKMYEGQQARALGTYQMQVYNAEATKAFSKLPREMSQGLKDAMQRDAVLTASAVQQALSRGDFASAAAVARNAGKVTSAFMQTVVGFRTIQDDLISRNAQYDRDRINFENQLNSMVLDGASARLENSSKKTQEALQAQLDAAQATRKAAESDNIQQRNVWNDFARQSEQDYKKLASEARAYNKGGSETVVINIPEGQSYSSQEVADYMTQATRRIDAIEVRLDGTRASGSDYFAAH